MSKKLFIPGPIDVSEDVLEKMATPVISHRSKEWKAPLDVVQQKEQLYSPVVHLEIDGTKWV